MKISMVGYTIPQSNIAGTSRGIARYVYYTASELVKMNNDVELYIRNDIKPPENWIKTISAPKFTWVPYPLFVYLKARKMKSDIYYADYVHTGAPLIWAKKKPTVVAIHDVLPFSYRKEDLRMKDKFLVWYYMRNFKSIMKADAIIVGSEHARQEAIQKTKIPEEKLYAVHYGIDIERLNPMKKENNLDVVKIGYLGGLDARKNVTLLIDCFKKISETHPNVELHIGGTGRNLEKFKSMGLPRMFLHGEIKFEDVASFLNSLDIFVFPTLGEGFGLPALEAMACGVPTIASNVTTMPELISDAGVLANPNLEEMTEAIKRLVEDKSLREKLSEKGVERAKQFTWRSTAEKTMKIFESVTRK